MLHAATHHRFRHAFTLIELVVVVVIFAVLAAAIVPRLGGQDLRAAKMEVRAVRDFLSAVAVRSSLVVQNLAVVGGSTRKPGDLSGDGVTDFTLMSPRAKGNAADFTAERPWTTDLTVPPVELTKLRIAAITCNGEPLAANDFSITFAAGEARPAVGIVLSLPDQSSFWRIELPPGVLTATVFETDRSDPGVVRTANRVDLDDDGMGETPW